MDLFSFSTNQENIAELNREDNFTSRHLLMDDERLFWPSSSILFDSWASPSFSFLPS